MGGERERSEKRNGDDGGVRMLRLGRKERVRPGARYRVRKGGDREHGLRAIEIELIVFSEKA